MSIKNQDIKDILKKAYNKQPSEEKFEKISEEIKKIFDNESLSPDNKKEEFGKLFAKEN